MRVGDREGWLACLSVIGDSDRARSATISIYRSYHGNGDLPTKLGCSNAIFAFLSTMSHKGNNLQVSTMCYKAHSVLQAFQVTADGPDTLYSRIQWAGTAYVHGGMAICPGFMNNPPKTKRKPIRKLIQTKSLNIRWPLPLPPRKRICERKTKTTGVVRNISEDDISWKSSDNDQDDEQAQDDEDADKNDVNETTQDDEDEDDHDDD
ncbi:hypothetical protein Tco_1368339 [Tanacetum coccineum]